MTEFHPGRRGVLTASLALAGTVVAGGGQASAAVPQAAGIKTVSLLQRKESITHDEFVRHWTEVHAPIAYDCPGISRYTLTIVKSSSVRKDVPGLEVEFDGIAELYFTDQAALDAYRASPVTRKLRDDGANFIGREIDFVTEERVVLPRTP